MYVLDLRFSSCGTGAHQVLGTKVNQLVTNLESNVTESKVLYDIDKCKTFCINSSVVAKNKRRNSYNIRKAIKDKVEKYDFDSEIELTDTVKALLHDIQEYEFDMFELSKATNGNEMIVLSTYLLNKHNLFVNCAIDPTTFNNFIT